MTGTTISKEHIRIRENAGKITHIEVSLCFVEEHINLNTYEREPSGFYLSVVPISRKKRDGVTIECFDSDAVIWKLIKEAKKRSSTGEMLARREADIIISQVIFENGLELAE